VRFDTASGSNTPATVYPLDYAQPIPGALFTAHTPGTCPASSPTRRPCTRRPSTTGASTVTATATLTGTLQATGTGNDPTSGFAATFAPLGTKVIDICAAPYNAAPGQDVTTALQNAINAAVTAGGGDIVFSKAGTYLLNGAPQTGTALTYAYNGQVLFPAVNFLNVPGVPIRIRGIVPASSGALATGQAAGVVLQSNASGAYMFDCVPAQSQWGWQWTGIMPIFENIILRSPAGGTAGGVNAQCVLRARFERVTVDVVSGVGSVPTGTLAGILGPRGLSNGDVTYRDVNVRGMPIGIGLTEHGVYDNIEIIACKYAFQGGQSFHACSFGYVDVEQCYAIFHLPTGFTGAQIDGSLDVEMAGVSDGDWNAPCYLVSPTSVGSPVGSLRITINGSTFGGFGLGPTSWNLDTSLVYGASAVGDPGGAVGWRNRHPSDTFARLQNLTLDGFGPGTAYPSMHPWRLGQGTFNLASGVLKSTRASGNSQAYVPCRNGGETRRVQLTTTLGASGYLVEMFAHRITGGTNSGNAIELDFTGGNVVLKVNGTLRVTASSVVTGSSTYTLAADVLYNNAGRPATVHVWLGTTLIISYSLTAAESLALDRGTASYPYAEDGLGFFSDLNSSITAFQVRSITPNAGDGTPTGFGYPCRRH
jgi:hypothetical protein